MFKEYLNISFPTGIQAGKNTYNQTVTTWEELRWNSK